MQVFMHRNRDGRIKLYLTAKKGRVAYHLPTGSYTQVQLLGYYEAALKEAVRKLATV